MRMLTLITLTLSLGLILPLSAKERAPEPASTKVAEALAKAAQRAPEPRIAVAATHTRLTTSIQKLEEFLKGHGAEIHQGWTTLLQVPTLKAELAQPRPSTAVLESLSRGFYQNHLGLERPAFLTVRRELRGYLTAREYAAAQHPTQLYRERVEELQERLTRLDAEFDEANAHRAGELVAWLEPLSTEGQSLSAAVRGHYCRTNGMAHVSARAVNLLMARKVNESNWIAENVMGAATQGYAYTAGDVSLGFVPNQERGSLEIRLEGTVNVPSMTAQRGQITAYSSSQTALRATKQVQIDERGLSLLPALAACNTSMQLQDINANSRLVERLAWRRASRMIPEAETSANQLAQTEVTTKLNEQGAAMLSGVNDTFLNKICGPLLRADALPPSMRFWTNESHLRLSFSQWNDGQLAAASPAPRFPDEYDMGVGAHESMINNFTEVLLGGVTTHDEGWKKVVELMTGSVPRPLWVHDRTPRWTATFEQKRPFIVHFDDNRACFTMRLTKVAHGETTFEHPVEVEARMIPRIMPDGPALFRDGELDIRVAPGMESQAEAELRKFLASKVGAVFPPEMYFDGFAAPAGGTIGRLRQVQICEMRCQDGWMTLGYKIEGAESQTAGGGQ
jgi:hypothetical protein